MLRPFSEPPARLRALLLALITLFTFAVLSAFASSAFAEDKKIEAAAKDALKKVEDDFLQGDYAKAIDKLKKAGDACGADKCTPAIKAQVYRDLGAMYFYAKKKDDAVTAFVEALKIEPSANLNINYKTAEVDAVYEEAKKKAGPATPPAGGGGDQPTGDFKHEAPSEAQVRTPFPIYVTYSGSTSIAKVVAKYKAFGDSEFTQIELAKMGDGWGGLIACKAVTQGTLQYYVQGFDASNDPVANSGDRNKTFKVAIKDKIDGDAPHLPGASPPKQCQETGDCPPDFPGCKKDGAGGGDAGKKDEGEDCETDNQCKSDKCTKEKCAAGEGDGGKKADKAPKFWIGVSGGIDIAFISSGDDVCKLDNKTALPINGGSYYCTNSDGTDYPFRNDKGVQNGTIRPTNAGGKNQVGGGAVTPSNYRVMLTFDYAVNRNFLIGARIGLVLNTYPGAAAGNDGKAGLAPIHAELRGTYVIGKDALVKAGPAPMVFLGAGASQFDGHVDVTVIETGTNGGKTVQAWTIAGPVFATFGGGLRYAFTPRAALLVAPKISAAFGGAAGFLLAPGAEAGVQFGF